MSEPPDRDEPVNIPFDPKEALRASLQVDPDDAWVIRRRTSERQEFWSEDGTWATVGTAQTFDSEQDAASAAPTDGEPTHLAALRDDDRGAD